LISFASVFPLDTSTHDELTERYHAHRKYCFSLSLDKTLKPYYFGIRSPNVSAVFTTALLDLASVRSTRATAANQQQLTSACPQMSWVQQNSNVTSEVMG
jgi:hypothetical protein